MCIRDRPYSKKESKIKIKPNSSWLDTGKTGLEKFFDKELRGKFGRKRNEVTSKGHIVASQIYEIRYQEMIYKHH